MPPPSSPRASVVRACLLALVAAAGDPADTVEITIHSNGSTIVYAVGPDEARAVLGPVERPALTGLESELLAVLTDRESKPGAIALRAGKNLNSHVYDALRALVTKGYARRGERGGYLLLHSRFDGIE